MPVKNTESFLSECLDSIIQQTYSNWELIAIDDHSTDASAEILNSYSNQDKRIIVHKNHGSGIIPALQLGYKSSKGKFITRMDSDDLMTPSKLQFFISILQKKGLGHIAVGLVKYISQNQLGEGYKLYEQWLNKLTTDGNNYSEIYKECSIPSPNWMVHRSDFENCLAFQSALYPEDYDLAFRFRKAQIKVAPVNEVTHLWRDHPQRASRNDANYSDNRFTSLKIKHFKEDDYMSVKQLILWGAGAKGKAIALELNKVAIPFKWISNNPKKIGHVIYEVELEEADLRSIAQDAQVIVAVSNQLEKNDINTKLKQVGLKKAYFFC